VVAGGVAGLVELPDPDEAGAADVLLPEDAAGDADEPDGAELGAPRVGVGFGACSS